MAVPSLSPSSKGTLGQLPVIFGKSGGHFDLAKAVLVGFLMLDLLEIPDSNPIEPLKYIRINEQRISADGI